MKSLLSAFYNHIVSVREKNHALGNTYAWWLNQLRKVISLVYNPIVNVKLSKQKLEMPLSHPIPYIYVKSPKYDRTLPRIAKKLLEIDQKLALIDVGANIGDTIFLVAEEAKGDFLAVEGNPKYIPLLEKNLQKHHLKADIAKTFCGEEDSFSKVNIKTKKGTAFIEKTENSDKTNEQSIKTIDTLTQEFPKFAKSNLYKIDTDGFELPILLGSQEFLKISQPLLYFEFTPTVMQKPMAIFDLLKNLGYDWALFYSNFGNPIQQISIQNEHQEVEKLIQKIDQKNIYYYDVLCCHQEKEEHYKALLKAEAQS